MKGFEFKPFEDLYEGETSDGRIVRCHKDDFQAIAYECEQAEIELTPDSAMEQGWTGFYVVKQHGGARPGAGRKAIHTPEYDAGYNAGFVAGRRAAQKEVVDDEWCGTCKSAPCRVSSGSVCCHDMVRWGYCQHEPLEDQQ